MAASESSAALSRRSLADQVADALVELILSEDLQDGDSLPSTAELSERFDVSRTVVREALATLGGRGILTRSQGRESIVASPGAADLSQFLQFTARRDEVTLGHILEVRYGIEIVAARLAAERATEADLLEITSALERLSSATRDRDFNLADVELHRAIALASKNVLIQLVLEGLADFLLDFRVQTMKKRRREGGTREPVIEEHRRLVAAIAAHDVQAAAAAMHDHLERSRGRMDPE